MSEMQKYGTATSMSIDLKRVEYLALVAAQGSFSKAASILGMAQPSLGRHIQKLEEYCHARLLYRHGRGVLLTPEGSQLLDGMRPLLRQIEALTQELSKTHTVPKGHVNVALTPAMRAMIGLKLILNINEKYPDVSISVISGYSGYIHEWLTDGRVDMALLHDTRRLKHLSAEFLGSARLYLISSPASLSPSARARKSIELRELDGLPMVMPTINHGARRSLVDACAATGAHFNVRYEMASLTMMKELVMAGKAHTVLALPAVSQEIEQGLVVARKLVSPTVEARLMLATALSRPITLAMHVVAAELKAVMKSTVSENRRKFDIVLDPDAVSA
jgi:LysR family nitrogen assimilation transcriptional regulator